VRTEAGHRFIYAVVNDFVDQVVQTALVGAADIHTGTAAYRFTSAKDVDRFGIIFFGTIVVPVFFWHRRGYIIFSHNRHSLQGDTNTNDFICEMTPEKLLLLPASDIVPIN
jgi:hypothetical protein